MLVFYRGHGGSFCRAQAGRYQKLLGDFSQLGATVILISADPAEASQEFRAHLGLSMPIVSDEEHQAADHYDIPIEYRSPRARVYAHGHRQPEVFAYQGETEVFRFIQRPRWYNLNGAAFRPTADKVLRVLRRSLR